MINELEPISTELSPNMAKHLAFVKQMNYFWENNFNIMGIPKEYLGGKQEQVATTEINEKRIIKHIRQHGSNKAK